MVKYQVVTMSYTGTRFHYMNGYHPVFSRLRPSYDAVSDPYGNHRVIVAKYNLAYMKLYGVSLNCYPRKFRLVQ